MKTKDLQTKLIQLMVVDDYDLKAGCAGYLPERNGALSFLSRGLDEPQAANPLDADSAAAAQG
jgi:hypothetical protein